MPEDRRMNGGNHSRSIVVAGLIGIITGGGAFTLGSAGITAYDARDLRLEMEEKIDKEIEDERLERKELEVRVRKLEQFLHRYDKNVPNL